MAAFGGTLSSYTWICLIIAFLQLRTPPVLPVLHELPFKTQKQGGAQQSEFADNLKKLRGVCKDNKSSEADLLFQFFRFYAHEFDYDKFVLSIRRGRLITKVDKKWHYAINNQLCVEEPFNTSRNLGNTVDEYSFKGLQQELRRAFDLISAGKLEEACEQYIFPKEEERVWSRPPPQSRPVLLRSASHASQQTTGSGRGRGGHRGGRHGNYHRGGGGGGGGSNAGGNGGAGGGSGPNRRTSSSVPTYDQTLFATAISMQQDLAWFQNAQFPVHYTPEMLAQIAYQQENMRQIQQMYAQNTYNQLQGMGGQQAMGSNPGVGQAQSADRSRTNSFDNPPLSAPIRPDLFALYSMTLSQPFYNPNVKGYGTYPPSPVPTTSGSGQDYRRPFQRGAAHAEKGAPASSSSLRSQSQPAARSQPAVVSGTNSQHPLPASQSTTNVAGFGPRYANGVAPNFISPEDDMDETPKANAITPQSEGEGKYAAYFGSGSGSPEPNPIAQQQQPISNGIAFGDLANQSATASSPSSGRLSSEQLPQSLLERRMRRSSRSPSPLRHSRAQSASTNPAPGASVTPNQQTSTRPLVVNGSSLKASPAGMPRTVPVTQPPMSDAPTAPASFSNPLQIHQPAQPSQYNDLSSAAPPNVPDQPISSHDRAPVVVNGSNANPNRYLHGDDTSFRERIAMMSSQYMNPQAAAQDTSLFRNGYLTPTNARQTMMSYQPQTAAIAPLDLAVSDDRVRGPMGSDASLLSPVYETRTPSPTVIRRVDHSGKPEKPGNSAHVDPKKPTWAGNSKTTSREGADKILGGSPETPKQGKGSRPTAHTTKSNGGRENGHARAGSDSGWQKAGKNKKKGAAHPQQGHAEALPKRDSERKGG